VSGQEVPELPGDLFRRDDRTEPLDDLAGSVHQKLLEVPCNVGRLAITGLLGLEPRVELGGIVTVDIDFREHRKVDTEVLGDKDPNLLGRSRLLTTELIAREGQDSDAVVIMMKRTQTCVLRREASSGRDVDDEAGGIGEIGERDLFTFQRCHFECMKSAHAAAAYRPTQPVRLGLARSSPRSTAIPVARNGAGCSPHKDQQATNPDLRSSDPHSDRHDGNPLH